MTKREEYAISFRRVKTSYGYDNFTETTNDENEQIAIHIENSGKRITELQIDALEKALNKEKIQEDWGEVMGSQLDIYVQRGTVQIAYTNNEIPIQDFKQLLEEWLDFITD